MVCELPAGSEKGLAFDKRKGHPLELRNRATKRLALSCIGPRFIHGSLSCPDALKRDQCAAVIEAAHDLRESLAFGTKAMIGGNADAVEEY